MLYRSVCDAYFAEDIGAIFELDQNENENGLEYADKNACLQDVFGTDYDNLCGITQHLNQHPKT